MIKASQKEFVERLSATPQNLRDFMVSLEVGEMLWLVGEVHHLNEERIEKMAGVLGYVVLGFIHIRDLAKEIASETNVDRRLAEELAREIQVKILAPVMPEIQKLYHYGSAPSTGSEQASLSRAVPTTPSQPLTTRPEFAQPTRGGQPFILHEEQKETESVRPRDETLVRPSFYEEPDIRHQTSDIGEQRPMAARLEIGNMEERATKGPQVGRTEESPIRVVHYSGPQTPVDPFGNQTSDISNQSLESVNQKPDLPKDIHPENVVDLKDLPK